MFEEKLHVIRQEGNEPGPRVVLVHGAPDRSKNFDKVVRELPGHSLIVYDRRGYGQSIDAALGPGGEVIGGFEAHANDLIDLLDDRPSIVVGQSAGGTIAMLAAVLRPELFAALGVWEPPMVPYDWWVGEEAMAGTMNWANYDDPSQLGEDMNISILGEERWNRLRDQTKKLLRAEGLAFRADMACQAEPLFEISSLQVPLVVGHGTEIPDHFVAANRRLAQRTGAEVFVGEGADHFAHLSSPDVWADLVRRTMSLAEN